MKLSKNFYLVIGICLFSLTISCSKPHVTNGQMGEWVKGKALSLKVNDNSILDLQNDSEKGAPIAPLKIVGWYKNAGKKVFEIDKKRLSPPVLPAKKKIFLNINKLLGVSADDTIEKIQIFLGPKRDQESFIITR